MSMTPDAIQMLLQSMQGTPEPPGQQGRVNALRGQQALGILGTMGGKNLAPFGQNMYAGATGQIKDIEGRQDKQLGRSLQALQGAKIAKDLMAPDKEQSRYTIVGDGQGGAVMLDKFSGKTTPVAGAGMAPGELPEYDYDAPPPDFSGLKQVEGASLIYALGGAPALGGMRKIIESGFKPGMLTKAYYENQGQGVLGTMSGWLTSDTGLAYVSFAKQLVNAIQRKESGAAIPEAEWQSALLRFVPLPWDSPELQQEKMLAAERSLRNIAMTAGDASRYAQGYISKMGTLSGKGWGQKGGGGDKQSNTITDDELE